MYPRRYKYVRSFFIAERKTALPAVCLPAGADGATGCRLPLSSHKFRRCFSIPHTAHTRACGGAARHQHIRDGCAPAHRPKQRTRAGLGVPPQGAADGRFGAVTGPRTGSVARPTPTRRRSFRRLSGSRRAVSIRIGPPPRPLCQSRRERDERRAAMGGMRRGHLPLGGVAPWLRHPSAHNTPLPCAPAARATARTRTATATQRACHHTSRVASKPPRQRGGRREGRASERRGRNAPRPSLPPVASRTPTSVLPRRNAALARAGRRIDGPDHLGQYPSRVAAWFGDVTNLYPRVHDS